jgi:hypothetical protein
LTRGNELTRIDYELLTNEQRYYVPIKVLESNKVEVTGQDPIYKVYVVSESFQVGNSPYAVGTVLSSGDYNALNDDDKAHVTQLVFPNGNYNNQTFYYCRESYTIGEHGNGVPVSNSATVTAKNSNGVDITVTRTTSSTDPVPVGLVIGESYYSQLADNNQQKNFTIHGIAPTETSTFYVSRESDIFDLSTEKIITVIYQYDYEECDENGNITPISERHVVNIHIEFKSGVPSVEDIKAPQIIIPGDYVNLREPAVTSGAYEVTGGGWELFETIGDAESHSNGIEYSPQFDPLYWYQDDWYVAYYAKTYLGKTYSNHVQVSVANYHDLKKVMEALKHHYYVDNPGVKRDPKIYINDYSDDASGSKNGLDLLKSLFDLSVLNKPTVSNETGLITSGDFTGHKPLNNIVRGGDNLDFILHTDIDHGPTTKPDPDHEGQTITENHPWSSIGSGNDCFAGTLHGDGHHLSGLDQSLFGSLCGQVYNLGVSGSFTGAGVAETGKGYVENCWVKTTGEIPANTTIKAVFGNPTDNKGTQVENCYYAESNAYSEATHARGNARKMPDKAFYNGEVAYNLNGFYLHKRYYDGINQNSGTQYNYLLANADGTLPDNMSQGYYPSDYAIYPLDPTKPNERGYVENRFFDGDFQYSNGKIPEDPEIRMRIVKVTEGTGANAKQVDKTYYLPIWPDDYLFFGQSLNYDHVTGRTHQDVPSAINRSGERLLTTEAGNRVYRAPAYFRSSEMGVAHFNPYAVFAKSKKDVPAVEAYKGMTAIDFTGHDDVSHGYQSGKISAAPYNHVENGAFYPPLLDDGGLSGLRNADLTKNLLVYTGTSTDAAVKTDAVVSNYLDDEAYAENDATGFGYVEGKAEYRTVAYRDPHKVYGHWVQQRGNGYVATRDHLLVDKQDFFAPMAYTFVEDTEGKEHLMWYQRDPDNFVDTEKGWEGISLPFTADIVTTQTKGELTHFYEGSTTGHEYWLRLFAGNVKLKEGSTDIYTADFNVPAASGDDKNVTNTFLWDYYYKGNEHNQKDMRQDTYQTYYSSSRQYDQYPRLAVGTPYLIGFPGATYYEFDLSGTWQAATTAVNPFGVEEEQIITFASPTGITINKSDDDMEGATKNGLTFKPNYLSESFKAGTANTFTLKADGSSYVKVPTSGGDVSVDAFRPYFTGAPSGSRTRGEAEEIIFSKSNGDFGVIDRDDPNDKAGGGLLIYAKKHKIVVESALTYATEVRIVNLAGMTINTFTIEPGETVETRINNAAVFIVQTTDGRYNKKLSVR